MARKCPDCGHMNDNELVFCAECGEPLDPQVRLVMELEGKKAPTKYGSRTVRHDDDDDDMPVRTRPRNRDDDDDEYIPMYHEDEKKKFPVGLLLLLAVAAVAAYFLFFK